MLSVPNYGVWYNRLRTLGGRFEYAWSGLYDRTHLRFFTRASIRRVLDYSGFRSPGPRAARPRSCSPRRRCCAVSSSKTWTGAITSPSAIPSCCSAYERFVEPLEQRFCSLWPELLGYQVVCVARPR